MKVNKKFIAIPVLAGTMALTLTGCFDDSSQPSAQQKENTQANAGASQLLSSQPVPAYNYSQLRQNLIELENAQANGVVTTTFFMNMGIQDPIMSCPSIGAPIASTTELTNPQQAVTNSGSQSSWATSIGQMDPTGVYTGSSTGTYIMCVGADGSVNPVYWEGFVMTAFGPAHWDKANHTMATDGPASSKFTGIKK